MSGVGRSGYTCEPWSSRSDHRFYRAPYASARTFGIALGQERPTVGQCEEDAIGGMAVMLCKLRGENRSATRAEWLMVAEPHWLRAFESGQRRDNYPPAILGTPAPSPSVISQAEVTKLFWGMDPP